jgi:(p)ppGpp synthase/HD superfamily hydrolase
VHNIDLPTLGPRFNAALDLASKLHGSQTRKGKSTPYLAHLLGVAALVLEDGCDEDQAIAALLHDAPEDAGGLRTLAVIRSRFGDRVAGIVDACTDSYEETKPEWMERKIAYLERLTDVPDDAVPVIVADKLYNVRSILADHRKVGDHVWDRFRAEPSGALWYYRQVANALVERGGSLGRELQTEVDRLASLVE